MFCRGADDADNAELRATVTELGVTNAKLEEERERYRQLYQQMLEKARKLELLGQKAERLPSSDAQLTLALLAGLLPGSDSKCAPSAGRRGAGPPRNLGVHRPMPRGHTRGRGRSFEQSSSVSSPRSRQSPRSSHPRGRGRCPRASRSWWGRRFGRRTAARRRSPLRSLAA